MNVLECEIKDTGVVSRLFGTIYIAKIVSEKPLVQYFNIDFFLNVLFTRINLIKKVKRLTTMQLL